jgi:hypothetical protein
VLVIEPRITRSLKIELMGRDYARCVWAGYNWEAEPVVCFADGQSVASCLRNLGTKIQNCNWYEDKFADDEDYERGLSMDERSPLWPEAWRKPE